jgi:hypothetical protein
LPKEFRLIIVDQRADVITTDAAQNGLPVSTACAAFHQCVSGGMNQRLPED